jgi:L-fuconolactonase
VEIVDSHQHFWNRARGDYDWLTPDLGVLYTDYSPDDLEPDLAACGVSRTILVQAAPTVAETNYMLELAHTTDFIAGVVGWVDFDLPDAPQSVAALSQRTWLRGVRPMIQDIDDPHWIAKPQLGPVLNAVTEYGLCFDALVYTRHIDSLLKMIARHPDLRVVIDHGAKPPIASGDLSEWRDQIARIAETTDAYCKLSGLVTEADESVDIDDIEPIFEHLYSCFGPDRLMWGSDWPVAKVRMEYGSWYSMSRELLRTLPADEQERILATNTRDFYGIGTAAAECRERSTSRDYS